MIPVLFLRRFFKYSPLDLLQGVLYNREKPIRATSAPSARTASEREIGTTTASPHPPRPPRCQSPQTQLIGGDALLRGAMPVNEKAVAPRAGHGQAAARRVRGG